MAYNSATESVIHRIDIIQQKGLRIACGSFCATAASDLQVETGDPCALLLQFNVSPWRWVNSSRHSPGSRFTIIRKRLKWKSNFTAFRSHPSVKVGRQTFTNSCPAFGRQYRKLVEYGNVWRWPHVGRQCHKCVAYGSSKSGLHIGRHCRKCVEYRCIWSGRQYVLLSENSVLELP